MRRFPVVLYMLVFVSALVVTGCGRQTGRPPSARQTPTVRLGYMPFASDLAVFVAVEKGYFRDEGVNVELIQFKSATENLNGLLAGRTDMTGMVGFPTILSAFEKDPTQFRVFLGTAETQDHWASAILVPPDSRIRSVADLKGKVVGTYTGTTQLLNLKSILGRFMDPEKDVTIRQVSEDLQLPSLQSKQFDALFTIEPRVTTAVDKGIGRILEANPRAKYILKPFPVTANCVSAKFLAEHRSEAEAVYRALAHAARDIRQDETAAKKFLPKYTPLEASLAEKCHLYYWWLPDDVDHVAIQKLADLFHSQGLLKTKVETSRMFVDFRG